jgi:hypothetical protein
MDRSASVAPVKTDFVGFLDVPSSECDRYRPFPTSDPISTRRESPRKAG